MLIRDRLMPGLTHQSIELHKGSSHSSFVLHEGIRVERDCAYSCEQCKNIFRGHNAVSCQLFVEQD